MIVAVADTHAAVWFLFGDARLSPAAKAFFEQAATDGRHIALSPISLAEVIYLGEKGRLPAAAFRQLHDALLDPDHLLQEAPFTGAIAESMRRVARLDVPDMPDRIVAATALHFGVAVISRDRRIRASNIQTVW